MLARHKNLAVCLRWPKRHSFSNIQRNVSAWEPLFSFNESHWSLFLGTLMKMTAVLLAFVNFFVELRTSNSFHVFRFSLFGVRVMGRVIVIHSFNLEVGKWRRFCYLSPEYSPLWSRRQLFRISFIILSLLTFSSCCLVCWSHSDLI